MQMAGVAAAKWHDGIGNGNGDEDADADAEDSALSSSTAADSLHLWRRCSSSFSQLEMQADCWLW